MEGRELLFETFTPHDESVLHQLRLSCRFQVALEAFGQLRQYLAHAVGSVRNDQVARQRHVRSDHENVLALSEPIPFRHCGHCRKHFAAQLLQIIW